MGRSSLGVFRYAAPARWVPAQFRFYDTTFFNQMRLKLLTCGDCGLRCAERSELGAAISRCFFAKVPGRGLT